MSRIEIQWPREPFVDSEIAILNPYGRQFTARAGDRHPPTTETRRRFVERGVRCAGSLPIRARDRAYCSPMETRTKRRGDLKRPAATLAFVGVLACSVAVEAQEDQLCAEFLAALETERTAAAVWRAYEGEDGPPFSAMDKSPEAQGWFRTKRALVDAFDQAWHQVAEAQQRVRAAITDKRALAVLDKVDGVMAAGFALDTSISDWKRETGRVFEVFKERAMFVKLDGMRRDISLSLRAIEHESLKVACHLGLVSNKAGKR